MDNILAAILTNTYSLTQLKHRIRILKTNLLKTFFGAEPGYTSETNLAPQDLDWLKSLPADFYQKFTKENVYKTFSDLDDNIAHLPILTMYLTFEPDEIALSQLGFFTRQQFNLPALLLDIKLNPNLIAGTALVWKGRYKDYSLRLKIEEKKSEIFTGFRKFLR